MKQRTCYGCGAPCTAPDPRLDQIVSEYAIEHVSMESLTAYEGRVYCVDCVMGDVPELFRAEDDDGTHD